MPSSVLIKCCELLKDKNLSIAFAESATAGRISAEIALIPECGRVLKGGIVCYDACIKENLLGVSINLIEKYTPESAEVTAELARRLKKLIDADILVAITGLTMPGGSENAEKPVGTMFMHTIVKGHHIPIKHIFKGSAEDIVLQTVDLVAQTIIDYLS